MTSDNQPTIVIAGMGPVGMTAALSLARAGIPVTVLEAGSDLSSESRASTFHPPSLEILAELGVVDELIATGLKAPGFQYRGRNRDLIAHLDMSLLDGDTPYPFRIQNEQGNITRIIRRHLEAMPHVTLRYDAPVERVELGRNKAYVFLPGDGRNPSYTADWVIAADGAGSAVRNSLGIAFEGVTYPERFLVASTTHDFLDDYDDLAYVSYVYDPDDWGVLLRTPNHWRVLFPIAEDETDEEALHPDRVEERLQGVVPLDEPYPVAHSTIYKVHQRLASTFGHGRILLAGDAAHINNPLGGMGMNSGIHDAHAAVQAVRFALDGGDPQRAVETYAKVRRDAAASDVQQNTQKNYEEMRERDAGNRNSRMAEMAAIAADPVAARAYLRGTSMLASFEVSRRRMTRGLSPVRPAPAAPAGQQLSDSIREGARFGQIWDAGSDSDAVAFVRAAEVGMVAGILDQAGSASALRIVELADAEGSMVSDAVVALERADIAAVAFGDDGVIPSDVIVSAVSTAIGIRRDLLVLATAGPFGEDAIAQTIERGAAYVEAGADLLGVWLDDADDIARIHRAVPEVPLVVFATEADTLASLKQLTLAGVCLIVPVPAHRPVSHSTLTH